MPPPSQNTLAAQSPRRLDVATVFVFILVIGALVVELFLIARLS